MLDELCGKHGASIMTASIFIARLLGPLFLLLGFAMLLKPAHFRAIMEDFLRSPAMIYLAGFFGLLGGIALVLTHNLWVADWRVIITLIGWLTIVRALVAVYAPELVAKAGSALLANRQLLYAFEALDLVLGLAMTYFGYFA
jgi:uncharacterized membrane protein